MIPILFQTILSGTAILSGTITSNQPAAFNNITLSTSNSVAPKSTNSGSNDYFPSFPNKIGGGTEAVGYQGSTIVNANMVIFNPYLNGGTGVNPVVLAYVGGSSGTFHCSGTSSPTNCNTNFSWFNLQQLDATYPVSECQSVLDNNGNLYFSPGGYVKQDFFALNTSGTVAMTTGGGGATSVVSNSANYAFFPAPTNFSTTNFYGWCTPIFDSVHSTITYIPTGAGPNICPSKLVQYTIPSSGTLATNFVSTNFAFFNMANIDANACGYLGASYDGQKYMYVWPLKGAPLIRYDTTQSFTNSNSYKELIMSNLGTTNYPAVTGTGDLNAIQTNSSYGGGIEVWDAAGANQYLYLAPFAVLPNNASSFNSEILQSQVIRVKTATCSSPVAGQQSCSSGFTALDITSSGSIWEIFSLSSLSTNQAWSYAYPPLFGPISSYGSNALSNQLVLGGFQLMWLSTINGTSDPRVGFIADFGAFYAMHDVGHTLSDPSGWYLFPEPAAQGPGVMGGAYDSINHLLYPGGANNTPPNAFQLGPL
jgi:hypothetical protein